MNYKLVWTLVLAVFLTAGNAPAAEKVPVTDNGALGAEVRSPGAMGRAGALKGAKENREREKAKKEKAKKEKPEKAKK